MWKGSTTSALSMCATHSRTNVCACVHVCVCVCVCTSGMWKAARLALYSTHHTGGDGETLGKIQRTDMGDRIMRINQSVPARCVIFFSGSSAKFARGSCCCGQVLSLGDRVMRINQSVPAWFFFLGSSVKLSRGSCCCGLVFSLLYGVVVCCRELQGVAGCCRVLQGVASLV